MSLICRIGRFVSRPVGKNWHSSQTRHVLTVDTSSPGNHSVLKSMSRETFSRSGHLSAYATFQRITADAATRGLTLLSTEWSGARSSYLFRCERGHRFSRRGAIVLRSTITCLQCVRQDVAVLLVRRTPTSARKYVSISFAALGIGGQLRLAGYSKAAAARSAAPAGFLSGTPSPAGWSVCARRSDCRWCSQAYCAVQRRSAARMTSDA
jgi:hypothetical protein